MELKALLTEDRAVSPVIGVILMVAITVILAAVIGTFVLGLGQNVSATPQASFNFDFDASSTNVNVTHEGGDRLSAGENTKFVNLTSTDSSADETVWVETTSNQINASSPTSVTSIGAGDTFGKYDYGGTGATVRVTWTGENGESSATLASQQAP